MSNFKKQLRRALYNLPRIKPLARAARLYLDIYDGNSTASMHYNGEADFLRYHLTNADPTFTLFDVGANTGHWSSHVLSINPNITLHAFEPDSAAFAALINAVKSPHATLNNLALGAESATRQFHIFGNASVHNSFYANAERQSTATLDVTVSTLDTYCADHAITRIDYLKIDVEGNELEVLRGASSMLQSNQIALIQLEYGDKWIDSRTFLRDLYDLMQPYPYRLSKLLPGGKLLPLARTYDYTLDQFRHSTLILTS